MTLTDAVIALLLTVLIHGIDDAVRATAKRCAKRLTSGLLHVLIVPSLVNALAGSDLSG